MYKYDHPCKHEGTDCTKFKIWTHLTTGVILMFFIVLIVFIIGMIKTAIVIWNITVITWLIGTLILVR